MTVLVAGASGATGALLVEQLCQRGLDVRAIVRFPEKLGGLRAEPGRLVTFYAQN